MKLSERKVPMSERTPDYTSRMPGEEQRITEQAVRLAALHYRDNMDADHAMGLEIFVEWDDPEMPETLVGYSVGTVHGMPGDQTRRVWVTFPMPEPL
tara:strand:- start:1726 stop:2016 length:291 start_codon:yes stop_codon:yes gene_type:complete